ncbi:MAG: coproporphyrinogen dehydrogenase HemZ, partial [Firmicutes bacterium]|nr:coproporphyrinogen dehydrogenase HemZ [Bacillota bacterium]
MSQSFNFSVASEKNIYELAELSRMFGEAPEFCVEEKADVDRNAEKRALYALLSEATGITLDWGILVGVRPSKLYRELSEKLGREGAEEKLRRDYLVSDEKIQLLSDTYDTQLAASYDKSPEAVSLYVGIPFCPTRCLYCSFTSNRFKKDASIEYMKALKKEIAAVKDIFDKMGWYAESIYIGGGTPTSLDDEEFEDLL